MTSYNMIYVLLASMYNESCAYSTLEYPYLVCILASRSSHPEIGTNKTVIIIKAT